MIAVPPFGQYERPWSIVIRVSGVGDITGTRKTFLNLGKNNNYTKLLNTKTIKEIEKSFYEEMKDLKYL